ncbi:MAG TPA: hypothetical protein VGH27_32845 [Streptosporangiaceae bacterium]
MTASPATDHAGPQATSKRITVNLIPSAASDLERLHERTNLSRTDLTNRAITVYEFFDAQLRDGYDLISRDNKTGKTRLVRFIDAPAGPETSTGPAFGRGPEGHRRPPRGLRRLGHLGRRRHAQSPAPRRPVFVGLISAILAGLLNPSYLTIRKET